MYISANFILSGPITYMQEIIMNDILWICIYLEDYDLCNAIDIGWQINHYKSDLL